MAIADQHLHHVGRVHRSEPVAGRHRGQDDLAEVIMLHPKRVERTGIIGALITFAG